ncbi:Acetyltransferase (GNAT) family protein [Catalinimonas alkaloidigena]|uniref:Acetyltransferase (GNAT) family protein n=1 Tax=Catalinimonas alkaloidigena TaxID=1075417 RepID=A0A1G8ZUA8_9BACT|nr:GNAT family N-acetyltransferase [Catalinimonas alkaloidigena]SDK18712.1 Acetyltransferase (GNAT) family protein [Catalinimonas alkaloidigena]
MYRLERTPADHPTAVSLIGALDRELWQRYPEDQAAYEVFNKLDHATRLVVAYYDDQPVGCGAFRPLAEAGMVELKRMFVHAESRGRGVGRAIVQALEQWAAEEGYRTMRLETGPRQPEAIALYEKLGYRRIPNYGPYAHLDMSLCMEKAL